MLLAKQHDFHTGNWKAVICKLKETLSDHEVILRSFFKNYLFIWLHQVLLAAHGIFSVGM